MDVRRKRFGDVFGESPVTVVIGEQSAGDVSVNEAVDLTARADEGFGVRMKAEVARISALSTEVLGDPTRTVEYYLLHAAQAKRDEMLTSELAELDDEPLRRRVDELHRYTSIGSMLLYQDANFRGASKFFTLTYPNIGWFPYKFNDKASSAKVWGVNWLFEHAWYGGRSLLLVGLPYFQAPDLGKFNFNDITSSVICLP